MESRDQTEHDEDRGGEVVTGSRRPAAGPQVVRTDDPVITSGPADTSGSKPDGTTVIETSRIRGPDEAFNPHLVLVPIEPAPPSRGRSDAGNGRENTGDREGKQAPRSHAGRDGDDRKGSADPEQDRDGAGRRHGGGRRPARTPSLTKVLLFSGLVALACGLAGAWGYSYFFGPSKSDDQKSSGKDSGSKKGSDSDEGSDSDKSSDSSSKEQGKGEPSQAEQAWLAAVKELRESREAEKSARRSAEQAKAVLDFLKRTLLSPGRLGDSSLVEAFWAGGQGKDVTLRKALDATEPRVAEAFAEQPLAEATVRELLGLAYLNVGEASLAVKQYERALALRQAVQGHDQADTAACRNQLAIAYRLAGHSDEASQLFERNPNSPSEASALAVRGAMLLLQKKPAEAELKLRECLTIRQKTQPDDWTTFDTKSCLGEALLDQKKFDDAEPLLVSGYQGMKQREDKIPARDRSRFVKALERLVRLYDDWGKKEEAMRWRKELEAAGQQAPQPS